MTTLNISLPEKMREYVNEKVAEGGYSTASEYVRQLIREDQKRAARERVDALLLEGIQSGPPIEATDEWWQEKETRLSATLIQGDSP
jgi:antitoxin ParD1/3/4